MALKKLPYRSVEPLVRRFLSDDSEKALALVRELRPVRARGYLTPSELEAVCRWKAPRAMRHIKANSPALVRSATKRALGTRSERQRLDALRELRGVGIPMASAVLMLVDPRRYGVIDIRVWQMLHAIGTVKTNPSGVGFRFQHWYRYLRIIRHVSKGLGVRARDVEWALFRAHKHYQLDNLYRS
jgi:hypothetical protein